MKRLGLLGVAGCLAGCLPKVEPLPVTPTPTPLSVSTPLANEKHIANLRQITKGGENAEAYWSWDGKSLSMQSTRAGAQCDRIWLIEDVLSDKPRFRQISSGLGRTTCAYFRRSGDVLYSSTHSASSECPPVPDHSKGYVWPLYDSYDIYLGLYPAKAGYEAGAPLIGGKGYDAEATVCGKDGSILFTSTRDGDIDLYRADADGKNVKRLTTEPGYDGGAFFSLDCTKIVWRASRPEGAALDDYKKLLGEGLVRPSKLEIFVMDADGSNKRQVTKLGAAAFAPSFLPDGKRILFASNHMDPKGRNFDLFLIGIDGSGLEQITTYDGFDGFPLISPDGRHLAFSSNRNGTERGETNVFIADWIE